MALQVPPTTSDIPGWVRKVASAVNFLLRMRAFPFDRYDTAPADPEPGMGYYDLTTNKARVWDGSVWNDLF